MKRIIISATSDLVTDQRVHKVASSCINAGYEVIVVGRAKKDSLAITNRNYKIKRFKLPFEKGPLFYAFYNLRLFIFLIFNAADAYIANDLDTLMGNYYAAKIKRTPLLYDNHEYFTGVPELLDRAFTRNIWKKIERHIFPKLKYVYTVNNSIKLLFENEYHIPVAVVRNIPLRNESQEIKKKLNIEIPQGNKVIIYQGAINKDRGVEEAIQAMQYLENITLLIVGDGDVFNEVKKIAEQLHIENKIIFTGKIPFQLLPNYTALADLGLCIEKSTNINYTFSLPNKLFDYIRAGVPILAADLIEVKSIINQYNIGNIIQTHDPKHIAEQITISLFDENKIQLWKKQLKIASQELSWENEEKVFLNMLKEAIPSGN